MLLYWCKNLKRKALIADISWSWGRNELEDDSLKDEYLEIENIGYRSGSKCHVRQLYFLLFILIMLIYKLFRIVLPII